LACFQYLHAGGLDVVDMHKNIGPTAVGSDKAISAICVEEFDPPTGHCSLNPFNRQQAPRSPGDAATGGAGQTRNLNEARQPKRAIPQKAICCRPKSDVLAREHERVGPVESPGPTINLQPRRLAAPFLGFKFLDYTKRQRNVPGL
jgi:hypothetical protein